MKHDWIKKDDGSVNTWAIAEGYHNGPMCRLCGFSFCEHCDPKGYDDDTCPGMPTAENTELRLKSHHYVFITTEDNGKDYVDGYWVEVEKLVADEMKSKGYMIKITKEIEE